MTGQKMNCDMILLVMIFMIWSVRSVRAEEARVFFHEDFITLDAWKPLTFPKIPAHSEYTIEKEGAKHVLKAVSRASASGLILKKSFIVRGYPVLRWRWRVSNVFKRGDTESKSGDDYPLRIYVNFKYTPSRADFALRAKYLLAKSIHGEFPPHSSLIYVWANQRQVRRIITNPYTDRAMIVALQGGKERLGIWLEEEVDILADYRAAFGEEPPEEASLGIMTDADNTGESATGWVAFIEVRR